MPKIEFYDLAKKKSFMSDKFKVMKKGNRHFAQATSPSGNKTMRIVSKEFAKKFGK
jgi:hypothetical protein